jgi:hypothetical protein
MNLGWCGLDWSDSGQEQVESSCECCNEPPGSIEFWESVEWLQQLLASRVVLSSIVSYVADEI